MNAAMQRIARIAFVAAACFSFVMAVSPQSPPSPGDPSDKIMHMLAFATLGALAAYGFYRQPIMRLFLGLTLFGIVIELVQAIPMVQRRGDIADVIADMAAALVSLAITRWAAERLERR